MQSRSKRGGSCARPVEPHTSSLWMDLFSLHSVILIIVTCSCLPFSYSRPIFRRHMSWQVLKIAFRSLQIWKISGEETPRPPYKAPHPHTKNLATALLCFKGKLLPLLIWKISNYIFVTPICFVLCREVRRSKRRKLVVIMKAMFYIYLPLSVTFFPVALSPSSSVLNRVLIL